METEYRTILLNTKDNVAVALCTIPAGTTISTTCADVTFDIDIQDAIEFGHKFAVRPIEYGEDIMKYGEVIGIASQKIEKGQHVHIHNLAGKRGRGDQIDK